jgi:hypothetical protein
MGMLGRKRAATEFIWTTVAEQAAALYSQLATPPLGRA